MYRLYERNLQVNNIEQGVVKVWGCKQIRSAFRAWHHEISVPGEPLVFICRRPRTQQTSILLLAILQPPCDGCAFEKTTPSAYFKGIVSKQNIGTWFVKNKQSLFHLSNKPVIYTWTSLETRNKARALIIKISNSPSVHSPLFLMNNDIMNDKIFMLRSSELFLNLVRRFYHRGTRKVRTTS